tara:strand:+ start:542 stop:649 length:108 start_codon:yes stop_codon:yes gene_type:complete
VKEEERRKLELDEELGAESLVGPFIGGAGILILVT